VSAPADRPLPPPLAGAVDKLKEWMRSESGAAEEKVKPRTLYHYTSDETKLRGILATQKLWCFIHNCQKDTMEFRYSLDIGRAVIQQEARRATPVVNSLLCGLDTMLADRLEGRFDFYFFSFSSHHDHSHQWTEYGDKGKGFAIEFAPALFQIDRYEPSPYPNENDFVGEVVYGGDAARTRHRRGVRKLAEIAERTLTATDPSITHEEDFPRWFDTMNREFIAAMFIWNCLTAKDKGFRSERETRYIIPGVRSAFDGCRKHHNGRAYVKLPRPLSKPGNITEILVGPSADPCAEAMVRELLQSNGYPADILVSRSKAKLKL
jgi:Protein of unknown function (DUF2971)